MESNLNASSAGAERLADLLMLSHEPMLVWRLDGPIEFWNAGAERLYGFSANEAIGRCSHTLLQTKFPVEFTDLRSQLDNRGYWSGELRHTCKDGREVVVDSRMQLLADGTVLEVNRDVTQVKALAAGQAMLLRELSAAAAKFEAIFNQAGIFAGIMDLQGHLREANDLSLEWCGYTHFQTVRQRKNGSLIAISLTVSPVKDAQGRIVGASKIARDITEQTRAQEQIATLAREAEHRSKNLLASVQATVHLSQAGTSEALKQAIEGRIQALANVNSLFVSTRWIGAELSSIATQELAPYCDQGETRVQIDGPQVLLEPNATQAIAVTLHELATNAAKYGALTAAKGRVELKWSHETEGLLILRWMEVGGPRVQIPARKGFGSRVIEGVIGQLKGKACFDWRPEGLVCEISLQT